MYMSLQLHLGSQQQQQFGAESQVGISTTMSELQDMVKMFSTTEMALLALGLTKMEGQLQSRNAKGTGILSSRSNCASQISALPYSFSCAAFLIISSRLLLNRYLLVVFNRMLSST